MTRTRRVLLLLAVLTGHATPAAAADTATLDSLEVYPTLAAAGVYASYTGDDDGDATAWVEYRPAGSGSYQRGHDLMPIAPGRLAGSVFFLAPGQGYDVRVVLSDPDNAAELTSEQSVTTRADQPAAATGNTWWVDATLGDDQAAGSEAEPFRTIGAGASAAQPGDTVRVRPGVYRETVVPPRGGTDGAPIWFLADGSGVVVDGSEASLENASWVDEGGGVFSTAFSGESRYVAVDDTRLYDYATLAELQTAAAGLPGGFSVDAAAGRLYVRMPDDSDPSGHAVHVAVREQGFLLDSISHVVIEGFELRYFGSTGTGVAIDVRDTSRAWIRNNQMHHSNAGVRVRRPLAHENVIENNSFRDTSVFGWPWGAVKAHTPEASAISITEGRGNIVRKNRVEGSFNGIYVGSFGDSSEAIAKDTDVYGNLLRQHGDDGLEPEGACVNVRFWNNVIDGVYNAVSLAPIEVGPTWLLRTLVVDYQAHVLKLNNGSTGWILVYHTTGVPLGSGPSAQALAPTLAFGPFVSRNNIYQATRYVIESGLSSVNPGVSLDFDALYTTDTTRFVKWMNVRYADLAELAASNTIEQNGFQVLPEYVDAPALDYDLVDGHALIDAGEPIAGINTPWIVGAAPDVGAFEKGGVSPFSDAPSAGGAGGATGGTGGSAGATGGSAGAGATGGLGTGGAAASGGVAAAPGGGGSNAATADDEGGCGCRLAGQSRSAGALVLGLLVLAAALRRRRR